MDLEFPTDIKIESISVTPLRIGQSEISSPLIVPNYIIDEFHCAKK
jgi:hypothetical protein